MKKPTTRETKTTKKPKHKKEKKSLPLKLDEELLKQATGGSSPVRWSDDC